MPDVSEIPNKPLCAEQHYTDGNCVHIIERRPINLDGTPDLTRPVEYIGRTNCSVPGAEAPVPVVFTVEGATTLKEARDNYEVHLKKAADELGNMIRARMMEARKQMAEAQRGIVQPPPGFDPNKLKLVR
jgi:hypothetical protein